MHAAYGGVVPELASRDHVRRVGAADRSACSPTPGIDARRPRRHRLHAGPGARRRAAGRRERGERARLRACASPVIGVHHLEGHLLSPLLADAAARVSVRRAARVGRPQPAVRRRPASATTGCSATRRTTRPARRSTRPRSSSGLPYPGGPALARLAERGHAGRGVAAAADARRRAISTSASRGLKTAVLTLARKEARRRDRVAAERARPTSRASSSSGRRRARREGAGGARRDRARRASSSPAASAPIASCARGLSRRRARGGEVYFPDLAFCTDNGAMIALAGALRLAHGAAGDYAFAVRPRWELASPHSRKSSTRCVNSLRGSRWGTNARRLRWARTSRAGSTSRTRPHPRCERRCRAYPPSRACARRSTTAARARRSPRWPSPGWRAPPASADTGTWPRAAPARRRFARCRGMPARAPSRRGCGTTAGARRRGTASTTLRKGRCSMADAHAVDDARTRRSMRPG